MKRSRQISEDPIQMKRGWNMENIIEIRNRRITINTDMHREDYCKTAILFEVPLRGPGRQCHVFLWDSLRPLMRSVS